MRIAACVVALLLPLAAYAQDAPQEWQVAKSTHFLIYYKKAPEAFITNLIERAEGYYNEIADRLGFRRYDFWLWENRARLYVHDTPQDFQAATGQRPWAGGVAFPRQKTIHTFPGAPDFFERTLPHEMAHIVFRELVGFDNRAVPLWLEEGVATYQEEARRQEAHETDVKALRAGLLVPLDKLGMMNPQLMPDTQSVIIFYAQSVGVVDFLIGEYGKEQFEVFCQNLRDKRDLLRALASAYPFESLAQLDEAWRKTLK